MNPDPSEWNHCLGPIDWVCNMPKDERHVFSGKQGTIELSRGNNTLHVVKTGFLSGHEAFMSLDWMGYTMGELRLKYDPDCQKGANYE